MTSKYRLNKWQVLDGYIWMMRWGLYRRVAPYKNTIDAIWFVNHKCGVVERTYPNVWRKGWGITGNGLRLVK